MPLAHTRLAVAVWGKHDLTALTVTEGPTAGLVGAVSQLVRIVKIYKDQRATVARGVSR